MAVRGRAARWGWRSAALLVGLCALVVLAIGGMPHVLVTHGISMKPTLVPDDLVLLRPVAVCTPGTINAYRPGQEVFLHRIVAVQDGRCVFQGDNNPWTDPYHPLPSELLGTLAVRVPGGGVWWRRLTSPKLLGVVAFVLITGTGTSSATRRTRRRRRQTGRPPCACPTPPDC